jgi:hypothetical protein
VHNGWNTLADPALVNLGGTGCTSSSPCQKCYGDCDGDNDCAGAFKCFDRSSADPFAKVAGCLSGGAGDVSE